MNGRGIRILKKVTVAILIYHLIIIPKIYEEATENLS
jgi:hypothetical protein